MKKAKLYLTITAAALSMAAIAANKNRKIPVTQGYYWDGCTFVFVSGLECTTSETARACTYEGYTIFFSASFNTIVFKN